ncbi:hypothetical protein EV421DRAFT_1834768 [Armillaria borealis]|uniref:Uncharacterized protein n=1 Tax=Armillaria borealis TaxID=47425 RepID=A0AA39J5I4_9AGAR|nr:hypothetical protein EV421DRAFT_1834768 [Armillaria borealis]
MSTNGLPVWKSGSRRRTTTQFNPPLPTPRITFTTPDNENLPIPSETLLALHATCAKVAQFSGITLTLAEDGSSGAVPS